MKIKKFLLGVALLTVVTACNKSDGGSVGFTDNEFVTRTVVAQSAENETAYPATIKGVQDVEIRPMVSGFITRLYVKEGDYVKRGQTLFTIDNVTYTAAVRQAQAAVNTAKAQLSTATLTYNNDLKLHERNVIGQYELESAKNSMESAQAQLAQAEASLASAKQSLAYCTVTSPANGVVGDLPYKVGALVGPSMTQAFTTVSDASTMQVYFSLTEKEVLDIARTAGGINAAIAAFPAVQLRLADGTTYAQLGKVTAMSGMVDQGTGTVSVRADFPNLQHLLKSGASAQVLIPHVSSNAIVVPMEAVSQVQNKYFMYKVGNDKKVTYVEVKVADENDGKNYIITSGLNMGDSYVVKGISSLSEGMTIVPITEEQYEAKLKKNADMAADQSDLNKLKEDLTGK